MAYQSAISSKLVQLGQTQVIVRFEDDEGTMPVQFIEFNWKGENIDQPTIDARAIETRQSLTDNWLQQIV